MMTQRYTSNEIVDKGDDDIKIYQKVSIKILTISSLLLMVLGILSLGNYYIQVGITNKLLSYFEINILLICVSVIAGMMCLGLVIKEKPIRVVLNVLIVIGLILYLLYSFIVWVDTDYTEFHSPSGEERFLAIERHSGSDIYQVRGGIFIHRIGEIDVGDNWKPIRRDTDKIYWAGHKKMIIRDFYGNRVEMNYK